MPFLALDDAPGMAQCLHVGGQLQVKRQDAAERPVLLENRSIALGNLHVHSRIPRCLAGTAGSVMPCWRAP